MISKDRTNVQLHKKFTKCGNLYLEISIEIRSTTIIFVWREYIANLVVRGFDMRKTVHSFPKTINFYKIQVLVDTQQCCYSCHCDDFVFRKVNWPPAVKEGWVGGFKFNGRIAAKRDET